MESGVAISAILSNNIISYSYQNMKTLIDKEQGLEVNILVSEPQEGNRKIR